MMDSLRISMLRGALLFCIALLPCLSEAGEKKSAGWVGSAACAGCHTDQYSKWKASDHQHAMAVASEQSVVGNFSNASFQYFDATYRFMRDNKQFIVEVKEGKQAAQRFPVAYTFGVYPLQQYLIGFPGGRYQALTVAWDARPKAEGGQRWFSLYPDTQIKPDDPLHWQKHFQNWNTRCADCHSTNLQNSFNTKTQTYTTTWSEISVGCEACHGPAQQHLDWAKNNKPTTVMNAGFMQPLQTAGIWQRSSAQQKIATRTPAVAGDATQLDDTQLNMCAACHSRRSQLDNMHSDKPYLDRYRPSLLDAGLYHPDGQIQDEVYEYGSFLQSRMYAKGVTCSNCHDAHSLQVTGIPAERVRTDQPGNGACLQCHNPASYATPQHHKHAGETAGTQCVSCHMPLTTYMGVDKRRDHSLRIPRPDLTQQFKTPNACQQCHQNKGDAWIADQFRTLWPTAQRTAYATQAFAQAAHSPHAAKPSLVELAQSENVSAIVRATAFSMLPVSSREDVDVLRQGLQSTNPLLQLGALQATGAVPLELRRELLLPLLSSKVLAVRSDAGHLLAPLLAQSLPQPLSDADRAVLQKAVDEYRQSQETQGDTPGAHFNLGNLSVALGDTAAAEKSYREALRLVPDFMPAITNLSDLYSRTGKSDDAKKLLQSAIKRLPNEAMPYHQYGLLLVREQQKDAAMPLLKKSVELAPENARYAYVYAIALHDSGKAAEAITLLESIYAKDKQNIDVRDALVAYYQQAGEVEKAGALMR